MPSTPTTRRMPRDLLRLVAVLAMFLAACGGGDDGDAASGDEDGGANPDQDASGDPGSSDGELTQHGFVTVDGTTYNFSFDPPGRCGLPAEDGRIVGQGVFVDDPNRQVAFTYGLPENAPDGQPSMQIIVYDEEGQQLWYSAVGYTSNDVGSISDLAKNGNTVTMSGQLSLSADGTLADFTAEATCDQ